VSLLRGPQDWEQPDRSHTSEPFLPRKSTRGPAARIGRGTFACPSCDVPVVATTPIPVSARMRCPFCRRIHPARLYLRLDETDTELNEVQVTARVEL
jgi:hypothetical protein